MTDLADMATEIEGEHLAAAIGRAKAPIATGAAGQCDECGHWMPRLVDGRCGFCRDGRLPPDDWEPPTPPADFIPKPKETPMPAKTIQLPAYATDAIAAVERHAAANNCTIGDAARALIEAGTGNSDVPVASVVIKSAVEPWADFHGDLPDYDHPLRCVFESGIQYAVELLAKELGVERYEVCDGTEEFDGDLGGTIINILRAAGSSNQDGDYVPPRELSQMLRRAGDQSCGPIDMTAISLPALFEELERRIARADTAATDLIARAEAAERKLATIREAMA